MLTVAAGNGQDARSTKMPMAPRCPFHQDAHASKIPMPVRCLFHQDAHGTKMPMAPTGSNRKNEMHPRVDNQD
ncbi:MULTISPECIES: hypothetical protein [Moorena]|uniref:Uncharacterized protein n=1 Tax=Moorena producens 3L TaxID=489825 RepID=F4XX03_9CYAN|nr:MULTISPECIES: hypothetical protein [Moorena]EGJ30888.1 hypothetical protein LYNGBM3L_46390 [Moorena producens 3L]NEP33503.1 hypothetical protein [Moorena sp. SIO3B2]NEP64850.1 hypothetical protein [Moorena sp. SIO3A5]NEQ09091.1 hypothetical protein [Moorena sp. SIO4E2]OLT66788.1 hypothetical protein BI334_18850 [Moorena producens 3L]